MTLYKTKNGQQTGVVPGVGEIVNGKIEGPDNLESANLVKVETQASAPVAPPASPPAPQTPPEQPTPQPAPQTPANTNQEAK